MDLQKYLEQNFALWQPAPPKPLARGKHDVTLSWSAPGLDFLKGTGALLYRLERKEKIPPWVLEYCGGKTTKRIDNLAPCCPHKFRLRVIIKAEAVSTLADKATEYYGNKDIAFRTLQDQLFKEVNQKVVDKVDLGGSGDKNIASDKNEYSTKPDAGGDTSNHAEEMLENKFRRKWLASQWSELMFTSTESEGSSAVCFCMAVRGGYLKHVQSMLEERPELVGIINNTSGYTPLATAVRTEDLNMVKLLLSAGAEVDQLSATGQTALHLAVCSGNTAVVDQLLEKGADFQARDRNKLRVEHCAVDSGDLGMLRHILALGGDVTVKDSNYWTPLFRAVILGSPSALVEELVMRGSCLDVVDRLGLTIPVAAKLLTNRHGKPRHSVMRLVDGQYPREKALANFTRLTKKISSVHSLIKPPSPNKPLK